MMEATVVVHTHGTIEWNQVSGLQIHKKQKRDNGINQKVLKKKVGTGIED